MLKRRRIGLTANSRLPRKLSSDFLSDLKNVLDEDVSIRGQYLKAFYLTKYCEPDATLKKARRDAAIQKWHSVEKRNRLINECLVNSDYLMASSSEVAGIRLDDVLCRAQEVILDVIGTTPSLDIGYAMYSGGASTSKRRKDGHPAIKFLEQADSSRRAWFVFSQYIEGTAYGRHIREAGLEPRFVDGSVLFTVPKNTDIDRVACKEPDINVFFQKSFGNQIRYLLKRVGVDLNDQTVNGGLAMRGSIDGSLATLDLSSASDSVTVELVRRLLPPDWFYFLDAARSHRIDIDGILTDLEMFSSMGNGFTFELESLIFYALARAVAYMTGIRGRISVYGDDIIVPTGLAPYLITCLRLVGFSVNNDKSFVDGPFRESCGSYWHEGVDVKPFFIKGPITYLTDLIKVLNQLVKWSLCGGIVDPRYEVIHETYRAFIPPELWGGQDLSSITSLVTGDAPRKELREVTNERKLHHIGGLLMWYQLTYLRQLTGDVKISGMESTRIYRLKPNRQWRTDLPVFLGRYENLLE